MNCVLELYSDLTTLWSNYVTRSFQLARRLITVIASRDKRLYLSLVTVLVSQVIQFYVYAFQSHPSTVLCNVKNRVLIRSDSNYTRHSVANINFFEI